jgi:Leucine-rich repeat (LRR) protein
VIFGSASMITDLSPLSACKRLKTLVLEGSMSSDLTPLLSMPLLEELLLSDGQ